MKFNFECEDLDGLVIMDKAYIDELDNEMLYCIHPPIFHLGNRKSIQTYLFYPNIYQNHITFHYQVQF